MPGVEVFTRENSTVAAPRKRLIRLAPARIRSEPIMLLRSSFAGSLAFVRRAGALSLGAALLFAGCGKGGGGASADSIPVGEYACLTGLTASFGTAAHNGTTLVVEKANANGGVLGKKLKLITEDDQSKPGEAATAVRKLISRDKVVAVLGEVASSRSLEAAPICQQNKIPMISPGSTNPKVTEVGDYIFRVCFIDPFQGDGDGEVRARHAEGERRSRS